MTERIRFDSKGEAKLPREILEEDFLEEDAVLKAHRNEQGDVVLKRLPTYPTKRYSEEDLAAFAAEDNMSPDLKERFLSALKREPRLFRR